MKHLGDSMITESYMVNLFGINTKYYTIEFIAYLWEQSANAEYNRSGLYVTAMIDTNRFVCGEIRGCSLGDTSFVISVVRNPVEALNEADFFNAFINVVDQVRENLGSPSMSIEVNEINYYFFAQV